METIEYTEKFEGGLEKKMEWNDLNVGFIVLLCISSTTDGLVRNRKYLELFQAYIERLSSTFLSYINVILLAVYWVYLCLCF